MTDDRAIDTAAVLAVRDLRVHFPVTGADRGHGVLKAVDGISFELAAGETLGLVGESGCGKSTTGRAIMRFDEPTSGEVEVDGRPIGSGRRPSRSFRRALQMIFQDPYASLNPRMTVMQIVGEALDVHGLARGAARRERVHELLELVGLKPDAADRYAREFSGGQRQRIGIARALAVEPRAIICDEPVSALDVSIQAQIVNLLRDLQRRSGVSYLFIAHDLGVVRHMSDRVAVMYLGKLMEIAPTETLFSQPRHPYTLALMSAAPIPDPERERARQRIVLEGDVPSPVDPPRGCRFQSRCPYAQQLCRDEEPVLRAVGAGHRSACHFAETLAAPVTL